MARGNVRVLPAAAEDAREAWTSYHDRNPEAADAFLEEYARALERIEHAPLRAPTHLHGTRRMLMRRFPYSVIYRAKDGRIDIIAVAHQRRRIDYWWQR
jgi:plasmid stabilization system protein ParE